MTKSRKVFIVLAIILLVAAGVIAGCLVFNINSGVGTPISNQPVVSSSPTSASVATVYPTIAVAQPTLAMGTDPLVGSWHGSTSLFFGMATADYSLVARADGTMTISGIANAPIAGVDNLPFSVDATWTHPKGTTYVGAIGDKSMEFTCDGSKLSLSVNPYEAGFVDYEILNMDIDFTLTRG